MSESFYEAMVVRTIMANEAPPASKMSTIQIPITVHPDIPASGVVVIMYPGITGNINGYNDKYRKMADHMRFTVGAVIRSGNHVYPGLYYTASVQNDLAAIIEYTISNAEEICTNTVPIIYLIGFSAGASAVAAVAYRYPQVKKMLLITPSGDAGQEATTAGLGQFTGEVSIVGAADDEIVGPEAAPRFFHLATTASARKMVIVPNCGHQFHGRVNGMIMSKAPGWAFLGDESFPSPEGGLVLYD